MTTAEGPLDSPYRAIRATRARDDGPWPGVLVRTAGGQTRLLVDVDALGTDWRGWAAEPDGHLLAPLDVVRRGARHDVMLPVCSERLDDFVRRRTARMPLSSGEAVTLGVSVLRGCAELVREPETAGEWWLDDDGRPVLATDASSRRALDASAAVLEQVRVAPLLQPTWDTAVRALSAQRVSSHDLAAAEEALFDVTEAEPLVIVSLAPRSAAEHPARGREASRNDTQSAHESAPPSVWQTLVSGVDSDLADTVSRATTAVWRRLRPSPHASARAGARRAPWLVGGAVAVCILAGGAFWPTAGEVATGAGGGSAPTPAASAPPPLPAITASPSAPPAGDDPPAETTPVDAPLADLARITSELLDARLACEGAQQCLAEVTVDAAPLVGGAIDLPSAERSVTLLDDFGDLAVLRVDTPGGANSQMIVILRRNEKWLLRDVSDVAQQP